MVKNVFEGVAGVRVDLGSVPPMYGYRQWLIHGQNA